jgi:DNA-binding transcriptional MerR regulator
MKRGGGRRYYRPEDVELLRGIRQLLYSDGYTIKGVQKILREQGVRYVMDYMESAGKDADATAMRDIPDVAADAARSAGQRYEHSGESAAGGALPEGASSQLKALLGELEQCRELLAAAREGGDAD